MSLADELLADLDEDDLEDLEDGVKKEEEDDEAIDEITEAPMQDMSLYDRITDVAKLTESHKFVFKNWIWPFLTFYRPLLYAKHSEW